MGHLGFSTSKTPSISKKNHIAVTSFADDDTNTTLILPKSIVRLNLSQNYIKVENSSLVLRNVRYIDLSNNNISCIQIIGENMIWLDLSFNRIVNIDKSVVISNNLQVFNVSHNMIRKIHETTTLLAVQ